LETYRIDRTDSSVYAKEASFNKYNLNVLQSFIFAPENTFYEFTYTRTNFISLVAAIGGLLYSLRSVSNGMVVKWTNYSIDNDMMRKLYSVNKDTDEDGAVSFMPSPKNEDKNGRT
jgi:hypothetical protein